jgi:hypothetical protein
MSSKAGRIIPAVIGGIIGGVVGGPAGATAGFTAGSALTSAHDTGRANTRAKEQLSQQTEIMRTQSIKADKMAKEQALLSERALKKISQGRVRAASRRVRGGLFGDSQTQQYAVSNKLGG